MAHFAALIEDERLEEKCWYHNSHAYKKGCGKWACILTWARAKNAHPKMKALRFECCATKYKRAETDPYDDEDYLKHGNDVETMQIYARIRGQGHLVIQSLGMDGWNLPNKFLPCLPWTPTLPGGPSPCTASASMEKKGHSETLCGVDFSINDI